jgi:predicted metalloprotease
MRLDNQRESRNIENRQGQRGVGFGGAGQQAGGLGGGGGRLALAFLPFIFSKFGIIGVVVVLGGLFLFSQFGNMAAPPAQAPAAVGAPGSAPATRAESMQADTNRFVAKVLGSTEDTWERIFASQGQRYPAPTLVLFTGGVQSACGSASSAAGPFYCPADRKIYLDTSFFDEMARRFGAPGDFAAAYVIAHEVGHHVQTVTGISEQVNRAQRSARSKADANQALMRLELQADCLAGVWAANNRDLLDEGDFEQGVRAAQAIGDDTLQRSAGQRVVPDSFTHGSSEQRVRWLTVGFRSGDPNACDTFTIPASQL